MLARAIALRPDQKRVVAGATSKCQESCGFLYPVHPKQAEECAATCTQGHRQLLELENASGLAMGAAAAVLVAAILVTALTSAWLKNKAGPTG